MPVQRPTRTEWYGSQHKAKVDTNVAHITVMRRRLLSERKDDFLLRFSDISLPEDTVYLKAELALQQYIVINQSARVEYKLDIDKLFISGLATDSFVLYSSPFNSNLTKSFIILAGLRRSV